MDLHSGIPIWTSFDDDPTRYPQLTQSLECEVAIIGGGITGALLAHRLTDEGRDVVLLDKRVPGRGSTLASTGLLQYALDVPLEALVRRLGRKRAVHAYRRGVDAINELEEQTSAFDGRCGFARRPSLYLASRWWHVRGLRREYELRKKLGFSVQYLTRRSLTATDLPRAHGAIRVDGDAQVNPFSLTQALLMTAMHRGLRAFSQACVSSADERSGNVTLLTADGYSIRCRHLVVATGYEATEVISLPHSNLQSTYVAVGHPLPQGQLWRDQSLVWETARPYFYARCLDNGRIMIGGADTAFHDDHQRAAHMERRIARLARRFQQLFPVLPFELERAWAGTFAETAHGLPFIGRMAGRSRTYVALGYGGNGITFAVIAARLIADLIAGRANDDEWVFAN